MNIIVLLFHVEYAKNGYKVSKISKTISPTNSDFIEDWNKDYSELKKDEKGSFRENSLKSFCHGELSRGYKIASYSWVDGKSQPRTVNIQKVPEEVPVTSEN